MNVGKTLFAQVMEFVPWKTFGRIIDRHRGDAGVRTLGCADLFRIMAFAQLTWRESLRDIEACLAANQSKLFHMGLKNVPARSTLSDALNLRDWRIYHALAMRLITRARALYATESLDIDLDATVYALDATTIDLCLSLFQWAPFRTTKAAVKMHTLLDLRGAIPAFIHISDGKMHEVGVLDFLPIEAGAFYVMDRGYLDFARLFKLHQAGAFFVTRATSNMNARRVYSTATDRSTGVICDQSIALNGFRASQDYPGTFAAHPFQGSGIWQEPDLPDQQHDDAALDHRRAVQEPLAGRTVLQVDQTAPAHQAIPWHKRERRQDANLVCGLHPRTDRNCQKGASTRCLALHIATDSFGLRVRENRDFMRLEA
ncbi:hypothetical protein QFZ94_008417 [Paraburkholderia sp. JPY465]